MSDEVVEQITKDPVAKEKEPKKKEKDPKKVAAGKKLAEYNKKAKEALAREKKREEEEQKTINVEEETKNTESKSKAWIPELSFTNVLSLVGIGFAAVDIYMRYYKNRIVDLSQVPTPPKSPPTKIPIPQPTLKIGML